MAVSQQLLWKIEMFGALRLSRAGERINRFRTQKTGALLAYLAYFPGAHGREVLIEQLWPDQPILSGRNNLRLALSALRRQLEPSAAEQGHVLQTTRTTVGLNPAAFTTDVAEFEKLLVAALTSRATGDLERAVEVYRGHLLPGWYEDWIPLEEQRLENLFFQALFQLLRTLEKQGKFQRALQFAYHGARIDPKQEEISLIIERLSTRAATMQSTPASDGKPKHQLQALPSPLTRFFGRRHEMEELNKLLSAARLVTLTGPGGAGKTRFAIETLRMSRVKTYFVPLADITDVQLLNAATFEALRLVAEPGTNLWDEIVKTLLDRPVVLILDNFEQLLPDGANWVLALLQAVPALTILVTSRVRLGVDGEREYSVAPLPLAEDVQKLESSASAQMFLDRAQAVQPHFRITTHNAAAVAGVLERLEGMPLAIELVAARAGVLSPSQMLKRLDKILDFPTEESEFRSPRHRSLRAAIDWSYQLLPPELRRFWIALSVFPADFDEAAARFVTTEPQALDFLSRLRDASLLHSYDDESGTLRLHQLQVLREYSVEQLTPVDCQLWERRHAEYYLSFAERHEVALTVAGLQARVAAELDNIRAALQWAVANRETDMALRLASALWWFWPRSGHLEEGRQWLARLLALPDAADDEKIHAGALRSAGWLALHEGDYDAAQTRLQASLKLARRLHDEPEIAVILNMLGGVAHWRGDLKTAYTLYSESLMIRRRLDNPHSLATALTSFAGVACALGQLDEAEALCREALPLWKAMDNPISQAWTLNVQARIAMAQQEMEVARALVDECLHLFRPVKKSAGKAAALHDLGEIEQSQGHSEAAFLAWQESLEIRRALHRKPDVAATLFSLAGWYLQAGEEPQAREYFRESLLLYLEMNNEAGARQCREELDKLARPQSS